MVKESDKDTLARWRAAESEYQEAIGVFMKGDSPVLGKSELIDLVGLRLKADRWRERYFKSSL